MNRKQANKLLPIIQAYAEGKAIESRCIKGDKSLWYDDKDPSFDDDFEYRIKPEPKYRSFKNAEECWQEMQKHQPFGWVKVQGQYRTIIRVADGVLQLDKADKILYFDDGLRYLSFADGIPFGIKEGTDD